MSKKNRRETDSFTVSFLDVASCGFGAMIILLMITKSSAPVTLEFSEAVPEATVSELQDELFSIRGETRILNSELNAKHEQLSALDERIARLRRDLSDVEGRFDASDQLSEEVTDELGRLSIARQTLTEEMQRLLASSSAPEENAIGGVPVDSEYIIFIIDTSGSMYNTPGNWDKMLEVIENTLQVYPEVKGIQVMNDMGQYMFNSYRDAWIPDTPGRRNQIISTLRTWNAFSNSSPVEGVTKAIKTFYSPDKKISIYVLGDDFQGGSTQNVLRTIDRINVEDADGNRLVRIHGIGFPTIFAGPKRFRESAYRFTNLMRELTQRNGGTFVALNDFQ